MPKNSKATPMTKRKAPLGGGRLAAIHGLRLLDGVQRRHAGVGAGAGAGGRGGWTPRAGSAAAAELNGWRPVGLLEEVEVEVEV